MNEKSKHCSVFLKLIEILGIYTAGVTAIEITVKLDFRCSYKRKNNGEKLLPRSLVIKVFEATSWFCWTRKRSYTDASIAVVNGFIACILVACDLYSSCRINKPQLSIGEWLCNHEENTLVFFRSWSRYFSAMYFHVFSLNFQTSSFGFFVSLLFSRWNCIF